ncbi:hypothetical protein [Flammeovirga kamogawensis]|uniref:DUF2892 domain-containing protein n=1 Tax=Flammeovirga kamogawensis TaxID=373891 RepID=A0ABX8GQS3_9BACT|nr:hypothetical protein [Flammeovirga kamogawensis]MBB6462112.1 hypothetical protein [Flammeovirga kamogawensis]QWG05846.1 hypothetical protein KM029_10690 [Flammeovirga kamogawensis]TRX67671.1 hypothetical protein EO216_05705 [Flammeovirga kamogawensis]
MKKFSNKKRIAKMMAFGVVAVTAVTLTFMLLWNWLMPVIFGLTTITFWQALGLLVMSKIVFGKGKGPGFRGKEKAMMRREKFMHQMKNRKCKKEEENTDFTDSKE